MSMRRGEPRAELWPRYILWALLALIVLVLGCSTVYRVAWDDVARTDYTVYRLAGQAAVHGGNLYAVQNERGWNYVYPPPFALLMVLFANLSLAWGALLWYLLEVVAIALSAIMSVSLLEPVPKGRYRMALYSLPLLYLSTLLVSGIMRCQASEFVIALVIATFYFHFRQRPALAGLCLAGAAAIKVFPLALLAYFIVRRQWRVLAATLAGTALLLLVLPALFWGWQQNMTYLHEWIDAVGRPALMPNTERALATPLFGQLMDTFKSRNQSLEALFLTIGAQAQDIRFLVACTGTVMLVLMGLAARRVSSHEDELRLCSAFLVWQLLIPPISETHYFGMMILPLTIMLGLFMRSHQNNNAPRTAMNGLGIMMLAVMVLIGFRTTELMRPLCLASLVIWCALLHALWQTPTASRTAIPAIRGWSGNVQDADV